MKRFLGYFDAKEFLNEKDPGKQGEIADRVVAEIRRRIDYIKQEEAALKDGKCTRLADRCASCGSYARMAGRGFCSLLSAYRYGPYVCMWCRKDTETSLPRSPS